MAVKTIKVDAEAYRRLKRVQRSNETMSDTIKRVVKPPFDLQGWFKTLEKNSLSDQALDAIEETVAHRRKTPTGQERRRAAS